MSATVLYQGSAEIAVLLNDFTVSGVATDPTTVSCQVTDPAGTVVVHTFAGASPADITKLSTGNYSLQVPCVTEGTWVFVWIGTGACSDIQAGTWAVSTTALNRLYCTVAELRSRIGMDPDDTSDDDQLLLAAQAATRGVDQYCGRYFWQGTDTRTFPTDNVETATIDDLVSVTQLSVDSTGSGTYDQVWATTDYKLEPANAPTPSPESEPYTRIRALAGAGGRYLFPFPYPLSNQDRVKITGVFGWPALPYSVKQAALQMAADVYAMKNAPFGVLGSADLGGMIRVSGNPQLSRMLWSYKRGVTVGV